MFLVNRIGLRGHDKIIFVQVTDFVGPPGHRNLAPFGRETRMVTLFFRCRTHVIGEC